MDEPAIGVGLHVLYLAQTPLAFATGVFGDVGELQLVRSGCGDLPFHQIVVHRWSGFVPLAPPLAEAAEDLLAAAQPADAHVPGTADPALPGPQTQRRHFAGDQYANSGLSGRRCLDRQFSRFLTKLCNRAETNTNTARTGRSQW